MDWDKLNSDDSDYFDTYKEFILAYSKKANYIVITTQLDGTVVFEGKGNVKEIARKVFTSLFDEKVGEIVAKFI